MKKNILSIVLGLIFASCTTNKEQIPIPASGYITDRDFKIQTTSEYYYLDLTDDGIQNFIKTTIPADVAYEDTILEFTKKTNTIVSYGIDNVKTSEKCDTSSDGWIRATYPNGEKLNIDFTKKLEYTIILLSQVSGYKHYEKKIVMHYIEIK